jgi:hypothetical protein
MLESFFELLDDRGSATFPTIPNHEGDITAERFIRLANIGFAFPEPPPHNWREKPLSEIPNPQEG